jgi:ribosomal protein S18 acetylase RimI-like enzyme
MSSSTDPISLPAADIPKAGEMLARSFHNDPMTCHLLPDAGKRRSLSARSYQCLLRYGIHCGEVVANSANLEGVAIWLPPEAAHGSLAKLLRACLFTLPLTAGPSFFLRFLSYHQHLDRLRREHTPFRHWYLQLLGVDPSHQGRGYATALVNPMLARFDREGLPCCLDTMNADNVRFYERFGFRVAAKSLVPKTQIGLWLMARGAGG